MQYMREGSPYREELIRMKKIDNKVPNLRFISWDVLKFRIFRTFFQDFQNLNKNLFLWNEYFQILSNCIIDIYFHEYR